MVELQSSEHHSSTSTAAESTISSIPLLPFETVALGSRAQQQPVLQKRPAGEVISGNSPKSAKVAEKRLHKGRTCGTCGHAIKAFPEFHTGRAGQICSNTKQSGISGEYISALNKI